ncbi:hypothetical protein D9758_012480 [Tetrapyrgos nigripes]|uniref:F-box domain-containing protein n=1 Tax=Tetrapyrgos nigripes TaxID=182062 RepID=A0A8H5CYS6_9AGAR|nr:hypothetical protein D9758_012480 [Tetrapyrgos nigripes]
MSPTVRKASSSRTSMSSSKSKSLTSKAGSRSIPPVKLSHGRHVPRRTIPPISTNLDTYDKKDPFQAFTTLLTLISALNSRIGGAQFKLTAEEQKLAVHLLGIIEPFIGSTPSRRTHFTRQPTEILDHIVSNIDSKHDLLNLALTCQRLHSVVIPRHFDYRVVRAKVSSISVWNHLIVNRSLAKNVRCLEILDERTSAAKEVVPIITSSDTDLESTDDELVMHEKQEKYVVMALERMTALVEFKWSCNHSPLSIGDMWATLLKYQPALREVVIQDNLVFSALAVAAEVEESGESVSEEEQAVTTVLPALKNVVLSSTKHSYGASKHPSLSRARGMLNNCPNLESLTISYSPPRARNALAASTTGFPSRLPANDLFLFGRWTNLRSLTLTNLRLSSSNNGTNSVGIDAAMTFFLAHSNVEALVLDIANLSGDNGMATGGNSIAFLPNTLPRLKEITAPRDVIASLLACPLENDTARPLEVIRGIRLAAAQYPHIDASNRSSTLSDSALAQCIPPCPPNDPNRDFLYNLKLHGSNVKRIELVSWSEMDDVRRLVECASKGLMWLDLGKRQGISSWGVVRGAASAGLTRAMNSNTVNNTVEWATLLSALPELTTFHGIKFFYEVANVSNGPTGTDTNHNHSCSMPLSLLNAPEPSGSDRSKIRKNDECASVLSWKCPKLRRVDHWENWEDGSSETKKVIVLVKEGGGSGAHGKGKEKVRWEVRRVRQ